MCWLVGFGSNEPKTGDADMRNQMGAAPQLPPTPWGVGWRVVSTRVCRTAGGGMRGVIPTAQEEIYLFQCNKLTTGDQSLPTDVSGWFN